MEIPVSFQLPENPSAYIGNFLIASIGKLQFFGKLLIEAKGIPNTG